MVYLLEMVIFHGYVSHNQMVTGNQTRLTKKPPPASGHPSHGTEIPNQWLFRNPQKDGLMTIPQYGYYPLLGQQIQVDLPSFQMIPWTSSME